MKNATISDVAALAGVSKSTVSAVLNNKQVVKQSTRRMVLSAMEELKYRPSPLARRGFRPATGSCIAVIIKEAQNPFYGEVLAGIQEVADEQGCLISVSSSEGRHEVERRLVQHYSEQEVGGLIIAPLLSYDADLSHLYELKRNDTPFVLFEAVMGLGATLVEVDNVSASARAVGYLVEQGHARIVHFAGPRYSRHSEERAEGVRRACSESHLVFDETMIVQAGHSLEDGYRTGLEYFRGRCPEERPTAVTCYNDLVAVGLLKALQELRIRVPQDVSVIGFDDLRLLGALDLSLTTVRVPKYSMGRRAAELLFRRMEGGAELPAERVSLDADLVVRDSTRPLVQQKVREVALTAASVPGSSIQQ